MASSGEFRLSISQALTDQLQARLSAPDPDALTPDNLDGLSARQGVYELYLAEDLVYVGSASRTLPGRLGQHMRKIAGRQNISVEDVGFTCLYVDEDLTVLAPEDRLIAVFRQEGVSPWNFNGFGNKDPGRNRDGTEMPSGHFDRIYPIRLDWICEGMDAGNHSVADTLAALKARLPFLLRYERSDHAQRDFVRSNLEIPPEDLSAEELLRIVAGAVPEYQITALPGYVIMYRERRSYPNARVIES